MIILTPLLISELEKKMKENFSIGDQLIDSSGREFTYIGKARGYNGDDGIYHLISLNDKTGAMTEDVLVVPDSMFNKEICAIVEEMPVIVRCFTKKE